MLLPNTRLMYVTHRVQETLYIWQNHNKEVKRALSLDVRFIHDHAISLTYYPKQIQHETHICLGHTLNIYIIWNIVHIIFLVAIFS